MGTDSLSNPTFAALRRIIKSWDPYGLIESGSGPDVYDVEVEQLFAAVPRIHSIEDAVSVVVSAFSDAYAERERLRLAFREAGTIIYERLRDEGLLPVPPKQ